MKNKEIKSFIQDGDLGISYNDCGPWRSYDIADCYGNDPLDAINNCTIAEIDQDGGELNCYGFDDAPTKVQNTILQLLGISWDLLAAYDEAQSLKDEKPTCWNCPRELKTELELKKHECINCYVERKI